jgi:ABC-type glutathione transport system ATPase component
MVEAKNTTRMPSGRPPTLEALIDLKQISKIYDTPSGPFSALQSVSLRIGAGEFVAVVGRSGSSWKN